MARKIRRKRTPRATTNKTAQKSLKTVVLYKEMLRMKKIQSAFKARERLQRPLKKLRNSYSKRSWREKQKKGRRKKEKRRKRGKD